MALTKLETTSIFLGILLSIGMMGLGHDVSLSKKLHNGMDREQHFLTTNREEIKNNVNPIINDLFKRPFLDKSDFDKIFIKADTMSPMHQAIIYGAVLQSIKNRLVNGTYGINQMSDAPIGQEEWSMLKEVYNETLNKLETDFKSFTYTPEQFEDVIKDDETFTALNSKIDLPIVRIDSMEKLIKHYDKSPEFYQQGWSGQYLKNVFENALSIKGILEQKSLDNLNKISASLRINHKLYPQPLEDLNSGYSTRAGVFNATKEEWDKNYKQVFGDNIAYWFRLLNPLEVKQVTKIDFSKSNEIQKMINDLKIKQ